MFQEELHSVPQQDILLIILKVLDFVILIPLGMSILRIVTAHIKNKA